MIRIFKNFSLSKIYFKKCKLCTVMKFIGPASFKCASLLASAVTRCSAITVEKMATHVQKADCVLTFKKMESVMAM
jgi:hydroxyacyl-ACP dehydratase HTD2-like protein with hotdog domain